MPSIRLNLHFVAPGQDVTLTKRFDIDDTLQGTVEEVVEEWLAQHDPKKQTGWKYTGHTFDSYDSDFVSPSEFTSLDDYADYIGKCEEHGEGYKLRFADVGDNEFDDQYHGCHSSEEDFTRDLFESGYEIPDNLKGYIDWERVNRDMMMDHSSYQGGEGFHIFSD